MDPLEQERYAASVRIQKAVEKFDDGLFTREDLKTAIDFILEKSFERVHKLGLDEGLDTYIEDDDEFEIEFEPDEGEDDDVDF